MPPVAGDPERRGRGAPGAPRVFVHSPSEAPDAPVVALRIPEFECLGERALLLARPGDVVCLAQPADPGYLAFLRSLAIGPRAEDVLVVPGVAPGAGVSARLLADREALDRLAARLRGTAPLYLSPFFATPAADGLARELAGRLGRPVRVLGGPPGLVRRLHEKRIARRVAQRLGIPVAPGEVVRLRRGSARDLAPLRSAILRRTRETGRAIIRGTSGASGSSTFTTDASGVERALHAIDARVDNAIYLVEPCYEAAASPNVEVVIDAAGGARATGTDQLLNEALVYLGSVHPSRAQRLPEMLADARAIAGWMRARGFAGRAGFDFVERPPGVDPPAYFLTEINPRMNGASYPVALLERLARRSAAAGATLPRAFRTSSVAVDARNFETVARLAEGLLFDPARGEGIVPYSVAALAFGKLGIAAFAPTPERAAALFEELCSRWVAPVGV